MVQHIKFISTTVFASHSVLSTRDKGVTIPFFVRCRALTIPYAQCMEYLPTSLGIFWGLFVGKYSSRFWFATGYLLLPLPGPQHRSPNSSRWRMSRRHRRRISSDAMVGTHGMVQVYGHHKISQDRETKDHRLYLWCYSIQFHEKHWSYT